MEYYKKAAKYKLRFASQRGVLTTEQLFELPINELDVMAVNLQKEYKSSGGESFLEVKSTKDKMAKLRFDIVLDVLNTKVDDASKAAKSLDTKAHNQKILGLIAEKQEGELKGKSIEELEAMIK